MGDLDLDLLLAGERLLGDLEVLRFGERDLDLDLLFLLGDGDCRGDFTRSFLGDGDLAFLGERERPLGLLVGGLSLWSDLDLSLLGDLERPRTGDLDLFRCPDGDLSFPGDLDLWRLSGDFLERRCGDRERLCFSLPLSLSLSLLLSLFLPLSPLSSLSLDLDRCSLTLSAFSFSSVSPSTSLSSF